MNAPFTPESDAAYETRTGNCARCGGMGDIAYQLPSDDDLMVINGVELTTCPRCFGTKKPPRGLCNCLDPFHCEATR